VYISRKQSVDFCSKLTSVVRHKTVVTYGAPYMIHFMLLKLYTPSTYTHNHCTIPNRSADLCPPPIHHESSYEYAMMSCLIADLFIGNYKIYFQQPTLIYFLSTVNKHKCTIFNIQWVHTTYTVHCVYRTQTCAIKVYTPVREYGSVIGTFLTLLHFDFVELISHRL
jgi:hypothetical protein